MLFSKLRITLRLFQVTRSGTNIVSTSSVNAGDTKKAFFKERVIKLWNTLPLFVKKSKSVDHFKANLEIHRKNCPTVGDNYWDISEEVLAKIESTTSEASRRNYAEYMKENPWVAKRRGINTRNC